MGVKQAMVFEVPGPRTLYNHQQFPLLALFAGYYSHGNEQGKPDMLEMYVLMHRFQSRRLFFLDLRSFEETEMTLMIP